ncbi:MAG: hypothetical protein AAFN05_12740 [Pseudomonadota bacterium]
MSYYDEAVLMTYRLERWSAVGREAPPAPRALGIRRVFRQRASAPAPAPLPWAFLRLVP